MLRSGVEGLGEGVWGLRSRDSGFSACKAEAEANSSVLLRGVDFPKLLRGLGLRPAEWVSGSCPHAFLAYSSQLFCSQFLQDKICVWPRSQQTPRWGCCQNLFTKCSGFTVCVSKHLNQEA